VSELRDGLVQQIEGCGICIPADLSSALAPAVCCLQEWRDHWLDLPEIERLRVGQAWREPVKGSIFNLRFENHLGLAQIQPYADGAPLCPPVTVEVISPKFPNPWEHVAFFRSLLEDLFARSVRLPFDLSGPTERGVREALQPPTPLFMLHFLSQYGSSLRSALGMVQARPHRCLAETIEQVPLAQASQADADVLRDIVRSPERWVRTEQDLLLARRLEGYAPTRIRQYLSVESLDTPENRFVCHFLRQLVVAAEELLAQRWWTKVPARRRERVRTVAERVRRAYQHPMFDDVGPMRYLPLSSQVLLRRDGYRTLLNLWRHFHCARRPLFARLQEAIEVRDIATLYEVWVFFALIDELRLALGDAPHVQLHTSAHHGLAWKAEARFPGAGKLVYNRGFRRPNSYSVSLRPDFSWMEGGKPRVVLDAKFRLERLPSEDEEDSDTATAKRADLYKMHTYRDALKGVRAAVAVYPGNETVFYDKASGLSNAIKLEDLLMSDVSGIGALPMRPVA
jgi:hypothetical protein